MTRFPHLRGDLSANDNTARVLVFEDFDLPIRIGVYDEEKQGPQRVRISVEILVLPHVAAHGDDFRKVVDYGALHSKIRALAKGPHIELQETLADEVARICLEPAEVAAVEVYVRKLDIYADCKSVGVRIVRTRQ